MKRLPRLLRLMLLAGFAAPAFAQPDTAPAAPAPAGGPVDCKKQYQEVGPVAYQLPYWEFDQTDAGWRSLGKCPSEQTQLLKRYIERQEQEQRNVRWHLAQTLALNGDEGAAAEQALLSVNPDEAQQPTDFSWNTYALATVAFLRKNRAAFDIQYEAQRRAAQDSPRNAINLKILDGLAACFDRPYREAYGKCMPKH